jgi:hypothetical protein
MILANPATKALFTAYITGRRSAMKAKIISAFLILALASLACGINVDLPQMKTPGPDITEEISIPTPESDEARLKLSFGAGELTLAAGAGKNLVEGTATYNFDQFKPVIKTDGSEVTLQMGDVDFNDFLAFDQLKNEWDLKLGDQPMELDIDAGAYDATYELGGLSLTGLSISDGAADVKLSFSEPNASEMAVFSYETGASNVKLVGLANANFSAMSFSGGAGDYTLDFSGELQRDAAVNVDTGLSNIILVIPEGVNAVVTVDSGMSNINSGPGWSQSGDRYSIEGEGPTLTIIVNMGAGNLTITN